MTMPNSRRELAIEFVKRFCSGDVEGLAPLLENDLQLEGPLFRFRSSSEYLDSLRKDPPLSGRCRLLSVTESNDSVSIFYEYERSEGSMTIAQLFKFKDQKISEILLVFDGRAFA